MTDSVSLPSDIENEAARAIEGLVPAKSKERFETGFK